MFSGGNSEADSVMVTVTLSKAKEPKNSSHSALTFSFGLAASQSAQSTFIGCFETIYYIL